VSLDVYVFDAFAWRAKRLTLYDPQERLVLRPTGVLTTAPTKRRWWKRER
jgi:hypothetical protein